MTSSQSRKQRALEAKLQRRADREIPVLEFDFGGPQLAFHGPIITTTLTIAEEHKEALSSAGLPTPTAVSCRFLIDTGADGCVVKHDFAEQAKLKLINSSTSLHGVGVDTTGRTYMGRIVFGCASQTLKGVTHYFAVDGEIQSGELPTNQFDGIIGRNILQNFEVIYNGMTGKVVMRFIASPNAQRLPSLAEP